VIHWTLLGEHILLLRRPLSLLVRLVVALDLDDGELVVNLLLGVDLHQEAFSDVPLGSLECESMDLVAHLGRTLQVLLEHVAHLEGEFDLVDRLLFLLHGEHLQHHCVQELVGVQECTQVVTLDLLLLVQSRPHELYPRVQVPDPLGQTLGEVEEVPFGGDSVLQERLLDGVHVPAELAQTRTLDFVEIAFYCGQDLVLVVPLLPQLLQHLVGLTVVAVLLFEHLFHFDFVRYLFFQFLAEL